MGRPKSDTEKVLTDTEVRIMNIFWEFQVPITVRQVQEKLISLTSKEYAYTTISTLVRVLEKKKYLGSQKAGRGHEYFALVLQKDYQTQATDHLVEHIYSGRSSDLVKNLIGEGGLNKNEISEVQALLDKLKG